jgi:hypothetical protein
MSGFLVATSFVTTLLIPADEFQPGGAANGRALAYLAHQYLGGALGTAYGVSTIAILWFAGASAMAGLPSQHDVIFVEVTVTDPSDFETDLHVCGEIHEDQRVLTVAGSSVPNVLAALVLHVRDLTGRRPHLYFGWTEGSPAANFLRYLVLGQGEVAPVTREILRRAEPDRTRRPHVHVG